MTDRMRKIVKIVLGGVLLLILAVAVSQAILRLLPQPGHPAYPGPDGKNLSSATTVSPESLCDQWFSYRKAVSGDQRARIEDSYLACVNARKTLPPSGAVKPSPGPIEGNYQSPFWQRPAGEGIIIETNFSRLHSNYRIENQWVAKADGKLMMVYAGGRQKEPGERTPDDLALWHGVLVVTVADAQGKILPAEGGEYPTPSNVGPVRIGDVKGNDIILATREGTTFVFDIATRQYISTHTNLPASRTLGQGKIVESGNIPYQVEGYEFVNYYQNQEGTMTLIAGEMQAEPEQGILVVVLAPKGNTGEASEETAYQPTFQGGALRIVDTDGKTFTLVTEDGLIFVFDVSARQFTSTPAGKAEGSLAISLFTATPYLSPQAPTGIPAQTATQRPTRTPLPTYAP